ncbi:hypothetical protein IQ26_04293 [Mesorhizobium tianshanense]|uniref:Uncharacterized protein n=1 Tax=Mesorhizobium tianshanense TaxID=39844 RepID=A0A562NKE5_9HYPH|nr:hypothetical protein IQ26_04293 [Mesorhizobium tianshanense]
MIERALFPSPTRGPLRSFRRALAGTGLAPVFVCFWVLGCPVWGFRRRSGPVWPESGRTYPVMAAHRRMLKAMAAIVTWAAALASPT